MESLQTQAAPVSSPSLFYHDSGQLDWSAEKFYNSSSWVLDHPWEAGNSMHSRNTAFPHLRTDNDDSSLFSSSLPNLFHAKMRLSEDNTLQKSKDEELIGNLLPDEEELFGGIADDYDGHGLRTYEDVGDDVDLFSSGGGMEMDFQDGLGGYLNGYGKIPDSLLGAATNGEHPYGEHPSRTLFVRNINSNVDDSELRSLFEQYGDIRTLYTACKHRGFVMISYYDIRAARSAMRALQNRPLRRRKLDIHFSIPKDNPSDKDVNQGTLVAFNLDASVSNDDLRQIFGAFGEVKEIRETPHKRHHKFIEFYDVRGAEAALRGLNRSDIAGKRIKLEPSRPGGIRKSSLLQQLTYEHEDPTWSSSPPGHPSPWNCSNQAENGTGAFLNKTVQALTGSPPVRTGLIGNHSGRQSPFLAHAHSLPEYGINSYSSVAASAVFKADEGNGNHLKRASSSEVSYGLIGSVRKPSTSTNGSLTSQQFLWGTNNSQSSPVWPSSFAQPSGSPRYSAAVLDGHVACSSPSSEHSMYVPSSLDVSRISSNGGLGDPSLAMFSPHYRAQQMFSSSFMNHSEFGRARRGDSNVIENKKLFQLDLERILNGEDTRTTLMIKNIPNKYTSKMLLAAIDEHHRGAYDFIYLPIDFKNKCNVGYAFINMISPLSIIAFYQAFHGKKWEKFNSEKVASLAYARIQGKAALVAHFQNSSLMNEDKRCRPILFHSNGPNAGDQEPFPATGRIIRSSFQGGTSPTSGSPKDELLTGDMNLQVGF